MPLLDLGQSRVVRASRRRPAHCRRRTRSARSAGARHGHRDDGGCPAGRRGPAAAQLHRARGDGHRFSSRIRFWRSGRPAARAYPRGGRSSLRANYRGAREGGARVRAASISTDVPLESNESRAMTAEATTPTGLPGNHRDMDVRRLLPRTGRSAEGGPVVHVRRGRAARARSPSSANRWPVITGRGRTQSANGSNGGSTRRRALDDRSSAWPATSRMVRFATTRGCTSTCRSRCCCRRSMGCRQDRRSAASCASPCCRDPMRRR